MLKGFLCTSAIPTFSWYYLTCRWGMAPCVKSILCARYITAMQTIADQFTYIEDGDFGISVDIRYASSANFMGRAVDGYQNAWPNRAYMTKSAAEYLVKVQNDLLADGHRLIIYDSYRPITAVRYFAKWARALDDQDAKQYFYPNENKANLFERGYLANYSGHSRGSTIDLSIIAKGTQDAAYIRPAKIDDLLMRQCDDTSGSEAIGEVGEEVAITSSKTYIILDDCSMYMGGHFDLLDPKSYVVAMDGIDKLAHKNRMILRSVMLKFGFMPYEYEWWHFTKEGEPFAKCYFDISFKDFEDYGAHRYKDLLH